MTEFKNGSKKFYLIFTFSGIFFRNIYGYSECSLNKGFLENKKER